MDLAPSLGTGTYTYMQIYTEIKHLNTFKKSMSCIKLFWFVVEVIGGWCSPAAVYNEKSHEDSRNSLSHGGTGHQPA